MKKNCWFVLSLALALPFLLNACASYEVADQNRMARLGITPEQPADEQAGQAASGDETLAMDDSADADGGNSAAETVPADAIMAADSAMDKGTAAAAEESAEDE